MDFVKHLPSSIAPTLLLNAKIEIDAVAFVPTGSAA